MSLNLCSNLYILNFTKRKNIITYILDCHIYYMGFAHNFILENTSCINVLFHSKKEKMICIPKNKRKLQNKCSFIIFFCLILLSYLHTTLFQNSSFSPNLHGKILKCFSQNQFKSWCCLMACFGFLMHWMAMEALMSTLAKNWTWGFWG
jgi:hypothetical protein